METTKEEQALEKLKEAICNHHYGGMYKWSELQEHIRLSFLEETLKEQQAKISRLEATLEAADGVIDSFKRSGGYRQGSTTQKALEKYNQQKQSKEG